MRVPLKFTAQQVKDWDVMACGAPDYRWRPSRPLSGGGIGLLLRLRLAYRVFTGRYDALDWDAPRVRKWTWEP